MPHIPDLPPELADRDGVQMNLPPDSLLPTIQSYIEQAAAILQPGERGRLVWIADTHGVNVAVVNRLNSHIEVTAWVGKKWSLPFAAGVVGQVRW